MSDGYKTLSSTFDARWNLCREIRETGPVGTPTMTALMFYFTASAWWKDKYKRKDCGLVIAEHASPVEVAKYTGLSKASVYRALYQLQVDRWIDARETGTKPGDIEVVVLLDQESRDVRASLRQAKSRRTAFSKRESVSQNESAESQNEKDSLNLRLATVSDLRKRA